jgi:hypothetical protein
MNQHNTCLAAISKAFAINITIIEITTKGFVILSKPNKQNWSS